MKTLLGDNPMNAVLLGGASMVLAGVCVGIVSRDVDASSTDKRALTPVAAGKAA
jgi:hypothetical protein